MSCGLEKQRLSDLLYNFLHFGHFDELAKIMLHLLLVDRIRNFLLIFGGIAVGEILHLLL